MSERTSTAGLFTFILEQLAAFEIPPEEAPEARHDVEVILTAPSLSLSSLRRVLTEDPNTRWSTQRFDQASDLAILYKQGLEKKDSATSGVRGEALLQVDDAGVQDLGKTALKLPPDAITMSEQEYAATTINWRPYRIDPEIPPYDDHWTEAALCAQIDYESFFPEKGESVKKAKQVCKTCPVRTECLSDAVLADVRHGVWGDSSERERRKLKRRSATH